MRGRNRRLSLAPKTASSLKLERKGKRKGKAICGSAVAWLLIALDRGAWISLFLSGGSAAETWEQGLPGSQLGSNTPAS